MKKSVVSISIRGGGLTGAQVCVYVNSRLMSITVFMRKWREPKGQKSGNLLSLDRAVEWVTLGIAGIVQSKEVVSGVSLRV